MNPNGINILTYRRQYLLTPEEIVCPFKNKCLKIDTRYFLYVHPDLVVSEFCSAEKRLILLGDLFDYEDPGKGNEAILRDLVSLGYEALLERSGHFAGRFVLILIEKDRFIIVHDATAARKVFFASRNGRIWFSSQQHLLAKVMGLSSSKNPSKMDYYRSYDFVELNNSDLGNTTFYDEITQLMSNHYFDVTRNITVRYWPLKLIQKRSFEEVAEKCSLILEGHMKSIKKRYDIMLPVTGGSDSRLLMSASRSFHDEVYYYINQVNHNSSEIRDIRTSRKLFKHLGMDFNVLPIQDEVDLQFKKIYYENNPLASEFFLPHIYNYYLNYQNKVNLPGNIASAPWGVYHMNQKSVSINEILAYYQVDRYEHANSYYHQWMQNASVLCDECKLNVINLFYWEERINNWGNQISIDKDIAQEDINPLNSRILNELFLSLPLRYNNEPDKRLHRKIIMNLWPELMKFPFNPSGKTMAMMLLAQLGLFTPVARTLYKASKII